MRSLFSVTAICALAVLPALAADRVKTANGIVESTAAPKEGVRSFKGIPFAQPPVGDLRWREPRPAANWSGIRNADRFGAPGRSATISASGPPLVTQPDLLLKPVAVSSRCFLVPVAVAFDRATRPAQARVILVNGERPHSISR
jgi:hypothetical protein